MRPRRRRAPRGVAGTPESAFETTPARPLVQPGRDRDACQRGASSRPRRSARGSGRPRRGASREALRPDDLADHEGGRRHPRARDAKTSTQHAEPALACRATAASDVDREIIAIMIVGKRTRKPQKMKACISPGTSRCSSFCWPRTIIDLVAGALRKSTRAVRRASPLRTSRTGTRRAGRKNPPADEHERGEAERAAVYVCTFRSSALIAGTISCRSPITA